MLTQALKRNVPLPLASIKNARAFLSVASLVDFVVWRLARSNRGSETFIVADTGHVSTPVFISHLGTAMGLRPRLFRFPTNILSAGLRASGRASLAESMLSSLEVDISKVRKAGWMPLSDTGAGLVLAFAENTMTSD